MKHKIMKKISLGALLLLAFLCISVKVQAGDWTRYQNSSDNNGVTTNPGPTDAEHAVLQWAVPMPEATTPPLVIGNRVYTASGNYVYCYDKTTGEYLGKSDSLTGSVNEALHPMVYEDKDRKLFVITGDNGTRIEALSLAEPEQPRKIWASESQSGNCYSPLTYHNGNLYTGTWTGPGRPGIYFCVSADNGRVKWSTAAWPEEKRPKFGFYWDGACAVGNYIAFASENKGSGDNEDDGSALYLVNATTGDLLDVVDGLKGNIRNTVVYYKNYLYVGTVYGRLYRIYLDVNSDKLGKPNESEERFSYVDLGGRIKATTLIHKNTIYVGVDGKFENGGKQQSYYKMIDCSAPFNKAQPFKEVPVPAEPTGAPVLSVAEGDDTRYFYFTCNYGNGGIYYFTDKDKSLHCLFKPNDSMKEACISSLALDSEGTLYYKNDSNYLMAVAPKLINGVDITSESGSQSGINWINNSFNPAVREYSLTANASVSAINLSVHYLSSSSSGVTSQCIVNGYEHDTNTPISLSEGTTKVELTITRKAITIRYTFNIRKLGANNTALGLLYYGQNYSDGKNLLPSLVDGKTEYSVDLRNVSVSNPYLWIMPEDSQASAEIYAVENIKDAYGTLKNGDKLIYEDEDRDGRRKYDIVPVDAAKNTILRVRVTAADKITSTDYQIKFIRIEDHRHNWSSTWSSDASCHWHECAGTGAACDAVQNSQKSGYGAHTGNWVITQAPTCTSEGVETFICTVCGYTTTRAKERVDHSFGAWVQSSQATVSAAEVQKRTCNVCGFTEEKTVGNTVTPVLELPGKLKSLSVKKGATVKFTLTKAASDSILSVTSANAKYVKVVSFQRTGVISLKAVKKGKTTVTISLASGLSRTYTVNVVTGTVKTTSVKVDNTKVTLAKNKTLSLRPVVTPFTSTQKITYKSSNKKVVTVTSAGKIKAVAPGTAKVTVTSGSKKTVVTVNVAGLKLSKTSLTVKRNKTVTLKASRYGISDPVTFTSSNPQIATVTAGGKIKGIRKGTATITVKAGAYSAKCKIKVK